MKTKLSNTEAAHMLLDDKNANWSRAGAFALVEYLEELEDDIGETIEYNLVSIRCDYSEYASLEDWAKEQWVTPEKAWKELVLVNGDSDEFEEAIRDYIREHGQLIEFDGGIIVSAF